MAFIVGKSGFEKMKIFRRYTDCVDGTTAIEFSLLAVPFVFTALSIIELSIYFATGVLLEGAVQDSSRLIRTGQLQQMESGDPLQTFLDELCDRAWPLMDCDNFEYQVEKLDDFSMPPPPTIDDDGLMDPPDLWELSSITSGCVAMVRVTYPFQFMTPLFGGIWSNYPNNTRLLMSTIIFQTEPYDFQVTDPTCSVS